MPPPALRVPYRQLVVILLAQILALIAQAWLRRVLESHGYEQLQAHYVAYLVVPPILLIMLAPVLLEYRHFLRDLFSFRNTTLRLVLAAVALGVATRMAWWSGLVTRISFGITVSDDPQAITGPTFSFACSPLPSLMLGAFVMAVLIPLMEETVHRGLLQSAFAHRGPLVAILVSALFFTVFHTPSSYGFVFLMGLVLGTQFWVTRSLWTTMITHMTYNGLVQIDWRCLQGRWNPSPDRLPLLVPGFSALIMLAGACLLVVALLRYQWAGAEAAPARSEARARPRRAR